MFFPECRVCEELAKARLAAVMTVRRTCLLSFTARGWRTLGKKFSIDGKNEDFPPLFQATEKMFMPLFN
jgi:hypothetical protein